MSNKNLKLNMVLNAFRSAISVIFPLITFPYISRCLGVNNVGKINFSQSIISYFVLIAGLGISTYAVREGARRRNDTVKIGEFASEVFTINLFSTVISYALLIILVFTIGKFYEYRAIILVLSISMCFTLFGKEWLCQIYEDYLYITIRYIVFQIVALVLMFLFVKHENDYVVYAGITVIASSGASILNYFHTKKYCGVRFRINLKHLKPVLILFFSSVAVIIYTSSDTTILGFLCSDYEVGIYSVSVKIYSILINIFIAAIVVMIPRISSLIPQKNSKDQINRISSDLHSLLISVLLPAVAGLIMLSKHIVILVSSSEFADASLSLDILSIALVFCVLGTFWGNGILIPFRKEKVVLKATIVGCIVNVLLNIILIPYWKQNAAALTTFISQFVVFLICLIQGKKLVSINKPLLTITKSLCGCFSIVIICLFINNLHFTMGVHLLVAIPLCILSYLIVELLLKNESIVSLLNAVKKRIHLKKQMMLEEANPEDKPGVMLSVLITTYNLEKYISNTLDSVIKQNLSYSYEILVGDDGSTDNTINIVQEYAKRTKGLVKLFVMSRDKENNDPAIVRASHNRINLAKQANGKYIVFLDGDDFFINMDALQNKIDILEDPSNRDCVMCASNFNFYYEDSTKCVPAIKLNLKRKKIRPKVYWKSGVWIHAEANVIRNIIDFNRLDDEYISENIFDDNLIVFGYIKHGSIYYLDSIDINYRQNEGGFLNQDKGKQVFVNMLAYTHATFYTTRINQDLRFFKVISQLYKGDAVINTYLKESLNCYGKTIDRAADYISFWEKTSIKRKLRWTLLAIVNTVYKAYAFSYLFGVKCLIKRVLRKK